MTNIVPTEFKPAYTVSNEDLRWITKQTPNASFYMLGRNKNF